MELLRFLSPDRIRLDVDTDDKAAVLRMAARLLGDPASTGRIEQLLIARERIASTGVGEGVAIPHTSTDAHDEPRIALLRTARPVPFDAVDGRPVQLIIAVLAPSTAQALHLRLLARIARLIRSPAVRAALLAAGDHAEILAVVNAAASRPSAMPAPRAIRPTTRSPKVRMAPRGDGLPT